MHIKKKKSNVFEQIGDNLYLKLLLCVVLCSLVVILFYIINLVIEDRKFHEYTIVDDIRFVNSIEKITSEPDSVKLEGYAFLLERESSYNVISVFLRSVVTKDEIWLNMEQYDRAGVSSYFGSEYDYIYSGFIASTERKTLNKDETYEIIINIDYPKANYGDRNKRKTVSTNQYILGGELYSYNPNDFIIPDMNTESNILNEVFKNGHLCLYQKEEGMYIYQYDGRLYWIAIDNFKYEKNEKTYIIYHLYSSQPEKLPKSRIKYEFESLDFRFIEFEYIDDNTSPYRVAVRDIPEEYAITYIKTGVYDREIKKSYWTNSFHLKGIEER